MQSTLRAAEVLWRRVQRPDHVRDVRDARLLLPRCDLALDRKPDEICHVLVRPQHHPQFAQRWRRQPARERIGAAITAKVGGRLMTAAKTRAFERDRARLMGELTGALRAIAQRGA